VVEETGLEAGSDALGGSGNGSVFGGQNQNSWGDEAEGLRRASVGYLRESITLCVEQLRRPRVHGKTKIRWAHCLAQQIAALVNLTKTMGPKEEEKLVVWLSDLKKKVPKKYRGLIEVRRFRW